MPNCIPFKCYSLYCSEAQSDSELQSTSSVVSSSDRGYTSDSELETRTKGSCPAELEVRPVPENGSWMLVSIYMYVDARCRRSAVCVSLCYSIFSRAESTVYTLYQSTENTTPQG